MQTLDVTALLLMGDRQRLTYGGGSTTDSFVHVFDDEVQS